MDPSQIILLIAAARQAIRLTGELANAAQAAYGITDEQMAKAEADAKAVHNLIQETP